MTWNEFKQLVDQRLAEQGSDGNIEIGNIDTSEVSLYGPEPSYGWGLNISVIGKSESLNRDRTLVISS